MALSCTKDFTVSVLSSTGDMPLDQAVYSATYDAIYAVRGGYLFKLNATTGALISSTKFSRVGFSYTNIAYDTAQEKLWMTLWHDPGIIEYAEDKNKMLYDFSPVDLSLTQSYSLITVGADTSYNDTGKGPSSILYNGGFLYVSSWGGSSRTVNRYTANAVSFSNVLQIGSLTGMWGDLAWDTDTSEIWSTRPDLNRIVGSVTGSLTSFGTQNPYGVCYCPSDNKLYTCGCTELIYRITKADVSEWALTGRPNANPFHIRYNPYDGLIYCPQYYDDTVAVINPAASPLSAGITIQTGFDFPYDMVFTPTKKWAVQHGNVGLQEVA